MWEKYFKITGCNRFLYPGVGIIDVNNKKMSVDDLLKAYKRKCSYISLTDAGKEKFEPDTKPVKEKEQVFEKPKPLKEPDKKGSSDKKEKPN